VAAAAVTTTARMPSSIKSTNFKRRRGGEQSPSANVG